MDEKKTVFTLYSEEKRKVILTIFHRLAERIELKNNNNFIEIFSVVDGKGIIKLENGESIAFNTGDSFIFDTCRNCEITFEASVEIFSLRFNLSDFLDGSYISVFDKDIIERFFWLLKILHTKIDSMHINSRKVLECMFLIENEFENRNFCSKYAIKSYFSLIISLIMQYYTEEEEFSNTTKEKYENIERALIYISENITKKITLDELAKVAFMGKTKFSLIFKKVTGMTVWDYIQNARVELASSYLLEKSDEYNITEVAYRSGFNNTAHFNKTFKKLKGKTPSSFKNNSGNPCF